MNENKQPYLLPMNREEAQRYNGIRMALMNSTPDQVGLRANANQYGVVFPQPKVRAPEEEAMPVPGGVMTNGGIRPDGMLPPAAGGDPADSMAMPQPMQRPAQQPGAGMDKRGLGRLMAGLAARTRGGF